MNKIKTPTSDKDIFREYVQQSIGLLSREERYAAAVYLSQKLLSLPPIQQAHTIIVYSALEDEISLHPFVEHIGKSKDVYVITREGSCSFSPTTGVIIVPGRAFTLSGKRIGRGGGWYDRFLSQYPQLYSIGACFECQIFDDIPQDEWDIPLNKILSSQ